MDRSYFWWLLQKYQLKMEAHENANAPSKSNSFHLDIKKILLSMHHLKSGFEINCRVHGQLRRFKIFAGKILKVPKKIQQISFINSCRTYLKHIDVYFFFLQPCNIFQRNSSFSAHVEESSKFIKYVYCQNTNLKVIIARTTFKIFSG